MHMRTFLLIIIFCAISFTGSLAKKREVIAGPISARVLNVYDGDTIEVLANVWPGHQISVWVRIRGIDAPEIRSKCAIERFAAQSARDRLRKFVAGQPVLLTNIKGGKYFGRVLANVMTHAGQNIEAALLASGLVRRYRGKRRSAWC